MNSKQQLTFILVFTVGGIAWLYWVRLSINSFLPPFQDPRESYYNFGLWHLLYGLAIFFPAGIALSKLKRNLVKYTTERSRLTVVFLYGLFGFFIVCYFTFCAIPLLSFPGKGFPVFFDMTIMFIGLPVYFLLILAGHTWGAIALMLKTVLIGSGIGLAARLICTDQQFEKAS